MVIPVEIDNQELLVRFVFTDDFKKKDVILEKLITQEVFMDSRGLGVSLQRGNYTTSNFCKKAAKNIKSKEYAGFVFFLKENYEESCSKMLEIRAAFNSELKYTPQDENGEYLDEIDNVDSEQAGNPSHSDIYYIEPKLMMLVEEATPNVALRLFSKILCSTGKLFIDSQSEIDNNLIDDLDVLFKEMSVEIKLEAK
jgi:hypothetical protein